LEYAQNERILNMDIQELDVKKENERIGGFEEVLSTKMFEFYESRQGRHKREFQNSLEFFVGN
jgi:hypothetical protein